MKRSSPRWLVVTDVMTDEGLTVEASSFSLRTDADRHADAQIPREDVERVVVCHMPDPDRVGR